MSSAGLDVFDRTIEETNFILNQIEGDLGWRGQREKSYSALRAVLHAIRDRLMVDVAVNFSAQLPLLLKGIFFDGWNSSKVPIKMDREDFFQCIKNNFKYELNVGVEDMVKTVLINIFVRTDPDLADEIRSQLPREMKDIFVL